MPELTSADVELFTKGRLLANDPETVRALSRAYAQVRHYCGWPVAPSRSEIVTLDGPGGRLLSVPTLNLTTLTSVVEDGVTLNVADIMWSASGLLRKMSSACWSWKYRSIVVTMTHGFDSAPDFDQAVLEAVDNATLKMGTGGSGGLKRYRVDDVEREWQSVHVGGVEIPNDGLNHALLAQYRILPQPS